MNKTPPTHGSLFDGFGGLRRGLEDAGFVTRWAFDLIYGQDLSIADPRICERVDLLSGGPPCEKGSEAATFHRGKTFITLWPHMLRFTEALRPDWVMVESVPGFQREMVSWTADLHQLGYGCAGQLLNSCHWVPQQRTRAFIVARLGGDGLDLWNRLYAAGQRMERQDGEGRTGHRFAGNCADCLSGGIYSRISTRRAALVAAGNAVTQPLACWLGKKIIDCIAAESDQRVLL